ncbi:glucan biosynthesis protein [Rhodobacteraceae bacterium DSL-40]|uniref:glucan biosynthesis protein n=1 Tax=Amaricoccus sp. B4 TaxID=3368557 RepID=UPI000DABAEDE
MPLTAPAIPTWQNRLSGLVRPIIAAAAIAWASGAAAQAPFMPDYGPSEPFSFDILKKKAEELSQQPFVPYEEKNPELLDKIDYDAHWKIRFRKEATVTVGDVPLQFFHMGLYFRAPVKMSVIEDGQSREIRYSADYFDMPEDSPARAIEADAGFAGFRIMRPDLETDWISFLGAAYFRTDGAERQYGLSARGLAIDTGLSKPEEFPRFSEFYIEDSADPEIDVIIYALLEGPSVTGAYRIAIANDDGQIMDVQNELYFRKSVERLGIAPLTSMFWYSEMNRVQAFSWRPEVHDSDGLSMVTGTGEQIWRPLGNPPRTVTSSFTDENPKGFGLIQRDREFYNYEDDGVFYNRRPSVWIEPVGDWGKGSVQLVEIPTDDEIYDNIAAYWMPAELPEAGDARAFEYRIYWGLREPHASELARTQATRLGAGGVPGQPRPADQIKVVIDFEGPSLDGLTVEDGVEPVISAGQAEVINPYVLPIAGETGWRMTFDLKSPTDLDTLDVRAYLAKDGTPLTETWLGQLHPAQIAEIRGTRAAP